MVDAGESFLLGARDSLPKTSSVAWLADDSSCAALNGGFGAVLLASRQIVSVHPRDQEVLRADICWSPKKDTAGGPSLFSRESLSSLLSADPSLATWAPVIQGSHRRHRSCHSH